MWLIGTEKPSIKSAFQALISGHPSLLLLLTIYPFLFSPKKWWSKSLKIMASQTAWWWHNLLCLHYMVRIYRGLYIVKILEDQVNSVTVCHRCHIPFLWTGMQIHHLWYCEWEPCWYKEVLHSLVNKLPWRYISLWAVRKHCLLLQGVRVWVGRKGISDKASRPTATSSQTSHTAMGHMKPHMPPTSITTAPRWEGNRKRKNLPGCPTPRIHPTPLSHPFHRKSSYNTVSHTKCNQWIW